MPLSKRRCDTHKGDYGHLFVLAGSSLYPGAAMLSAAAAMRAGAGAVTLGMPESLKFFVCARLMEVMSLGLAQTPQGSIDADALKAVLQYAKRTSACLVGPGLSRHPKTAKMVRDLLSRLDLPMVIDADGLNALESKAAILKKVSQPVILTPHPKEMSRLTGFSVEEIQRKRKKIAKEFALRYNVNLILKGHRSVVASATGEVFVNRTGNPGMASAGCGDVLSGIAGSFLAQGMEAFEAARWAAHLHGLSGDLAAKEKTQTGLIASDLIDYLPRALEKAEDGLRKRRPSSGRRSFLPM